MSLHVDLHQIVMQQAQVLAQLTAQLAASVSPAAEVVPKDYDDTLTGSDLVREHFRRGGGALRCYLDDSSDEKAVSDAFARVVTDYSHEKTRFHSSYYWSYAVACDDAGAVLTADQLLGGL